MNTYRVHFIDRMNFVFALEQVEGSTDAKVILEARMRPLPPYASGFEVWRDDRLVYRAVSRPERVDRDALANTHPWEMASA